MYYIFEYIQYIYTKLCWLCICIWKLHHRQQIVSISRTMCFMFFMHFVLFIHCFFFCAMYNHMRTHFYIFMKFFLKVNARTCAYTDTTSELLSADTSSRSHPHFRFLYGNMQFYIRIYSFIPACEVCSTQYTATQQTGAKRVPQHWDTVNGANDTDVRVAIVSLQKKGTVRLPHLMPTMPTKPSLYILFTFLLVHAL